MVENVSCRDDHETTDTEATSTLKSPVWTEVTTGKPWLPRDGCEVTMHMAKWLQVRHADWLTCRSVDLQRRGRKIVEWYHDYKD